MKKYHPVYSIGSFAAILLGSFVLAGCGAGTGQSLNAPSLSSRGGDVATGTTTGTKGVANSVLPAKRLGLFVSDYTPGSDRLPGATGKPGNFAPAAPVFKASDYAHVFVTVYKVELVSADEQSFPVWADDAGRVVDLAAIGGKGEVATLGAVAVPGVTGKKTYKRARITLGKAITFFKNGETTAKPMPIDDAVGRDDEGRPVITMVLDRPRDLGNGKEDLVIGFDRAAFTVADNRVTPSVREGRGDAVNADKQSATYLTGVVSESTAGGDGADRVFVVTPDGGARGETQVVWMKSAAPFFRADGKPSPVLSDGVRVAVRGVLQNNTKRLVAQSVALLAEGDKPGDEQTIRGTATVVNPDSGSLTVAITGLRGIEPAYTESVVLVGTDAVLRGTSGLLETKEAFFAGLKGASIEADGDYEPTTGVLTATRLRRVSPAGTEAKREATVLSTAKSVDGNTLTLVAPLLEWDGIAPPAPGKSWTVNAPITTVCRDKAGKNIALSELLAAAKNPDANAVRVVGAYSGGIITATRLELAPVPAKETVAATKTGSKGDKNMPDAKADVKDGAATKRKIAPGADESPAPETKASPGVI